MRNIRAREREKIIMDEHHIAPQYRPPLPSEQGEEEREQELGKGLGEQEIRRLKKTPPDLRGLSEQEIRRLKNTPPLRVFFIVVGLALLLLLIVGILGVSVFHFW
jgi:hypothetical protein